MPAKNATKLCSNEIGAIRITFVKEREKARKALIETVMKKTGRSKSTVRRAVFGTLG